MHHAEERPDFAEINEELQSKVRSVIPLFDYYDVCAVYKVTKIAVKV